MLLGPQKLARRRSPADSPTATAPGGEPSVHDASNSRISDGFVRSVRSRKHFQASGIKLSWVTHAPRALTVVAHSWQTKSTTQSRKVRPWHQPRSGIWPARQAGVVGASASMAVLRDALDQARQDEARVAPGRMP